MSNSEATKLELPPALQPYKDLLDAHTRRVAGFYLHGMNVQNPNHIPKKIVDNPTGSRIGGAAFITPKNPWPRDRNGRRMLFVAQINLAEMPPLEGYRKDGLLQFFIGDHGYYGIEDEDFENHNYSDRHNVCVRYIPVQEYINGQLHGGTKTQCKAIENGFFEVRAVPFDQYPSGQNHQFTDTLDWNMPNYDDIVDETSQLPHIGPPIIFGGGWPTFAQRDPAGLSYQHVVMQIRSNLAPKNRPRIQWGDSGFASFFISEEDLANWNFSRVSYYWDCY